MTGKFMRRGFTLIELLVVMVIIATLLSIAAPRYLRSADDAREAALKSDLAQLREAIDHFHADFGTYPAALSDLIDKRYLRSIPVDPITESAQTWQLVAPQGVQGDGGVYDVHSGAEGSSRHGEAYAVGKRCQAGFSYVGLLIVIVIFGLGSVGAGRILASSERAEREAELLFVGHQFRDAIASYYLSGPKARQYPATLEDLLQDPRTPTPRRHLRKIFVDPITGKAKWELIMAPEGGVMGVHSLSEREPMKHSNFDLEDADFAAAIEQAHGVARPASGPSPLQPTSSSVQLTSLTKPYSYRDWRFVYRMGAMPNVGAPVPR